MTDLEELIQYWKDNYSINYTHRTPHANDQYLKTIKYLTELNNYYKQQRPFIGAPTISFRRR